MHIFLIGNSQSICTVTHVCSYIRRNVGRWGEGGRVCLMPVMGHQCLTHREEKGGGIAASLGGKN